MCYVFLSLHHIPYHTDIIFFMRGNHRDTQLKITSLIPPWYFVLGPPGSYSYATGSTSNWSKQSQYYAIILYAYSAVLPIGLSVYNNFDIDSIRAWSKKINMFILFQNAHRPRMEIETCNNRNCNNTNSHYYCDPIVSNQDRVAN